jgi:RNA polymerase sigma-70 factor (ECF subfamily)
LAESILDIPAAQSRSTTSDTAKNCLEDQVVDMFEQLRDPLLRYLLALGLDAHDGEEIVQEAFLALFQHLQHGKSRHSLRSWIFRVAHNLALRRRTRDRHRVQHALETGDALTQAHVDPSPNPEEQLLSRDRQQRLRAVVDALSERDRYCLHLRAEGLRYREIADVLGISVSAVSVMLARGLARIGCVDR